MRHLTASSWVLWTLTTTFFAYQFILRLSPGVLFDELLVHYDISATTFAVLSGFYYLGYAGMQVPIGILLDKYGVRYVVSASAVICVIGNLPFIYTDSWQLALVGRFLVGLGSAAGALGAIKAVRMNFPYKSVSKMIGWTVTFGLIGAMNGKRINLFLSDLFGWQDGILYLSLPGIAIAILILIFVKKPDAHDDEHTNDSIMTSLLAVIRNPQIILLAIFGALLVGPLEAFADVWGSPYFINVFGFTSAEASNLSGTAIYFGMCIGSPAVAWIVDKYQCHYFANIFCGIVMALAFLAMIHQLVDCYYLLFVLNFIIGIMCSYQVIVLAAATGIVPANLSGIAIAFINMINMSSGFLFHYAFGNVMDSMWDGLVVDGVKVYSTIAYNEALYILPITLFIGSVGFFLIRPRKRVVC